MPSRFENSRPRDSAPVQWQALKGWRRLEASVRSSESDHKTGSGLAVLLILKFVVIRFLNVVVLRNKAEG